MSIFKLTHTKKKNKLPPVISRQEVKKLLGMMAVLHTWGHNLYYHPHVHFIVTGGGLFSDEGLWLPGKDDFLVPVKALSVLFRAKFRDLLKKKMTGYISNPTKNVRKYGAKNGWCTVRQSAMERSH